MYSSNHAKQPYFYQFFNNKEPVIFAMQPVPPKALTCLAFFMISSRTIICCNSLSYPSIRILDLLVAALTSSSSCWNIVAFLHNILVIGHYNFRLLNSKLQPKIFSQEVFNPGLFNLESWVEKSRVEMSEPQGCRKFKLWTFQIQASTPGLSNNVEKSWVKQS